LENEEHLPLQDPLINSLRISSNNLLSLINDILDFSKIDEGKVTFAEKQMSLPELMNSLKEVHLYKARENQNEIEVNTDPLVPAFVLGDETRLTQIMNNLIANAIKFTHNGIIGIHTSLISMNDVQVVVRFAITDTGIGIEKSKQSLVFERFTQANSDIDREYGGSGLGLTIVKKLLELKGSKICLESEPGKGSKFYFDLGFTRCESPEISAKKIKNNVDLKGLRILLVEDILFNVQMAERMLTHWKATVDVACNGQVAVDKCKASDYDIILMDIQMPIMDGITATKLIRTFDQITPIIALSASASSEINEDVFAAGMCDSVPKPFNPNEFLKVIIKWTKSVPEKI
jgi:CheY-like chemotaxis protein